MFFEKIKRPNQVKPQTRTFFHYNNNQTFTLFHSFARSLMLKLGDEGKYNEMVVDFSQLIISKIIAFNE